MAKNDNLKDFLTDVADAIREKKGTSKPINPQDFSTEIASIKTGGDGGQMEYWKVPANYNVVEEEDLIFTVASQMQFEIEGAVVVGSPFVFVYVEKFPSAFSVNMSAFVTYPGDGQLYAVTDYIAQSGIDLEARGYTKITEEEFYSIN